MSEIDSISRFLREVRGDNPGALGSIDMIDIEVYENRYCFEIGKALEPKLRIASRGSLNDPLFVVAQSGKPAATPAPRLIEPTPVAVPMCLPPDSVRARELLPSRSDITKGEVHFTSREHAMIKLLKVHIDHYGQRTNQIAKVGMMHPLMDSSPGTGKTTFARRYLAMIERFVSRMKSEQPGYGFGETDELMMDISAALFWEKENDLPPIVIRECLGELRQARTVLVALDAGSLLDPEAREQSLIDQLRRAVIGTFRVDLGDYDQFPSLVQALPKPIFIVLDDIGRAFAKEGANVANQREELFSFVGEYGQFLAMQRGVYFTFSGNAPFASGRSLRPLSLGSFVRIGMYPIKPHDITKILTRTFHGHEPLSERLLREYPQGNVPATLYRLTGGHPKSIADLLMKDQYFDI